MLGIVIAEKRKQLGWTQRVPCVRIEDLEGGFYRSVTSLLPGEAFKLLAWLEQERPRLQEALLIESTYDLQRNKEEGNDGR